MSGPDLRAVLDLERKRLSLVLHVASPLDWQRVRATLYRLGGADRPPPGDDGPVPPWIPGAVAVLDGCLTVTFADVVLLSYTDLRAVDVTGLDEAHLYLSNDPAPVPTLPPETRWAAGTMTLHSLGK